MFDAARAAGRIPVVYASSAAIYGDQGEGAVPEGAPPQPQTAYGADKLGCELHARVAGTVHGVATTGFRFFNVYGPRQDPSSPYSGVISIFFNRIGAGQGITVFGDGGQTRDFIFVADVVKALILGMEHATVDAAVFNVCTGRTTSLLELAETIGRVFEVDPAIRFEAPRTGDIRASLGNPGRARKTLGFEARTTLENGLRTMVSKPA